MNAIPSPCSEFFISTAQRLVGFYPTRPTIATHNTPLGRRGFRLTVTVQNKPLPPISAAAAQTNAETEEVETILSEECETVRVRFKLQKECAFGQEYMIVGDDEVLGSWNPSGGVSLTWSEGHMWTAEVDLPVDKMIKYKFVLKCVVGAVSWQPGPDRVLKTWKTENEKMISVSEDWDSPGLQNIVEDDPVETDSESLTAPENSDSTEAIKKEKLSSNDDVSSPVSQADCSGSTEEVEDNSSSSEDGTTEEAAVLVLGLVQEEEIGEAQDLAKPEMNSASAPPHSSGINGEMKRQPENILESDVQWGKQTLYKLLSIFGLR